MHKKDTCCGCSACATICPVCAISMCPDEKGFLYPLVNSGKCIRCYKCEQICPFKKDNFNIFLSSFSIHKSCATILSD